MRSQIILCLLWLVSCQDFQKEKILSLHDTNSNRLLITNTSKKDLLFNLKVNDEFPHSRVEIINSIRSISDSLGTAPTISAWNYVVNLSKYGEPLSLENWIHDPIIFLNSIGVGYCDDEASVLASIWQWLGYESRVWYLFDHVVPEVYYNSSWHMLDPGYEIFYYDEEQKIANVASIASNPELITNPDSIPTLVAESNKKLSRNSEEYLVKYSAYLADIYKSTENNNVSDWALDYSNSAQDFKFRLPQKAKIIFPIDYHFSNQSVLSNTIALKVTLYKSKSVQKVKIPLVLQSVEGKAKIKLNEEVTFFNDMSNIPSQVNSYNLNIKVWDIADSLEFFYSINPMLFQSQKKEMKVSIEGKNIDALDIKKTAQSLLE